MGSNLDEIALENFRTYLRIPSVQPNVNYGNYKPIIWDFLLKICLDDCVAFLEKQAQELNLKVNIFTYVAGKPVVVLTWEGTQPELPAILLNSHMDVVPVYPVRF